MRRKGRYNPILSALSWTAVIGVVATAALIVYCSSLFQELEPLMAQTPRAQPSTIYSDAFVLHKGDNYADSFLTERLGDLHIAFSENGDRLEWATRDFDYPESILPSDSPLRAPPGKPVKVHVASGRVDAIEIDGKDAEAVILEPAPVAQLAGATRSIRNYVKLENIPAGLLQAIIAIEDQRFLEHPGFDIRSLARAVWVNLKSRALSQGGSTLTQQLVKNLLGTHQKTLFRKVRELVLAILMEARYSKDAILEKYLNEVYFGQIGSLEVHGVAEAARYFFNKPLEKLSLPEMAMIAGVIRGPAVYSPYKYLKRATERKNTVLRKMEELRIITPTELKDALAEKLAFAPPSLVNNKAPYFVDYVKSQVLEQLGERVSAEDLSAAGLRVFTTLDMPLQRRADRAVSTTVRELEARYKIAPPLRLEGILVAADPRSGFVRALVGGRSYAETTFNRVLNMKRQAGSTFKPIAYLAAFEKGADANGIPYTGAYMLDDEPWTYKFGAGKTWTPHNYEKGYRGRITLREAFANSINIPMAKVGVDVGPERVVETARKLGVSEALSAIPSIVLGSIDISPMDLLQVYCTFANRGERSELTTVRAIVDENGRVLARFVPRVERVFEPARIDHLNSFLATVVREGTAKLMPAMGYSKPAFGKTGTTSFSRDAWFAGFSQGLAAVTWTGFDELKTPDSEDEDEARSFKPPAALTGAGAALPTWARFFAAAKPSPLVDPDSPVDPSLETVRIDKASGLRARPGCPAENQYNEVFLPNTVPGGDCPLHP
jgi:penicillin-binding protein 1B